MVMKMMIMMMTIEDGHDDIGGDGAVDADGNDKTNGKSDRCMLLEV